MSGVQIPPPPPQNSPPPSRQCGIGRKKAQEAAKRKRLYTKIAKGAKKEQGQFTVSNDWKSACLWLPTIGKRGSKRFQRLENLPQPVISSEVPITPQGGYRDGVEKSQSSPTRTHFPTWGLAAKRRKNPQKGRGFTQISQRARRKSKADHRFQRFKRKQGVC